MTFDIQYPHSHLDEVKTNGNSCTVPCYQRHYKTAHTVDDDDVGAGDGTGTTAKTLLAVKTSSPASSDQAMNTNPLLPQTNDDVSLGQGQEQTPGPTIFSALEQGPELALLFKRHTALRAHLRSIYEATLEPVHAHHSPLNTEDQGEYPLTCPDANSYYEHVSGPTSAQYYVNPAGMSVRDACRWEAMDGKASGNWAPVNLGVGTRDGATFISIFQNKPTTNATLDFDIEIVGDNLGGGKCSYHNGVYTGATGSNADGCTVSSVPLRPFPWRGR